MQTISDFLKRRSEERNEERIRQREKRQKLFDSSASVPVFTSDDDLTDSTDYRRLRSGVREALEVGQVDLYEFACDHCGTQLVNPEPGALFMSSPPRKRVGCPGCGWSGWFST